MKLLSKLALCSLLTLAPLSLSSCGFFGQSYSIESIVPTTLPNGDIQVEITFTSLDIPSVTFTIPKGQTGEAGNGIDHIDSEFDQENSQVNLTIYFTDEDVEPIEISVPVLKGETGVGIDRIEVTIDETTLDTVMTFYYTDDREPLEIRIPRGEKGNGIQSFTCVEGVDEEGNPAYICTMTFTDADTEPYVFYIRIAQDGRSISFVEGSYNENGEYVLIIHYENEVYVDQITVPVPTVAQWLYGASIPSADLGNVGDFYFRTMTGDIYVKTESGRSLQCALGSLGTGGGSSQVQQITITLDDGGDGHYLPQGASTFIRINKGEAIWTGCNNFGGLPICNRPGYDFLGWFTDPMSANTVNTTKVTNYTCMSEAITLYAHYAVKEYDVNLADNDVGMILANKAHAEEGEEVTFTFIPFDKSIVSGDITWTVTDNVMEDALVSTISINEPFKFTLNASDITVSAAYSAQVSA